MAPSLLPELLLIVRQDGCGAGLQRKALAIVHVVVQVLHTMAGCAKEQVCLGRLPRHGWVARRRMCTATEGVHSGLPSHLQNPGARCMLPKRPTSLPCDCLEPLQVKAIVSEMLPGWLPELNRALSRPPRGPASWGLQLECLRILTSLVSSFSRLCAPHIGAPLSRSAAWRMAWRTWIPAEGCLQGPSRASGAGLGPVALAVGAALASCWLPSRPSLHTLTPRPDHSVPWRTHRPVDGSRLGASCGRAAAVPAGGCRGR